MSKNHVALVLEVLGLGLVTAGFAVWSLVAGLIVGGIAVALFGLAVERL